LNYWIASNGNPVIIDQAGAAPVAEADADLDPESSHARLSYERAEYDPANRRR
jgi:hypothetical protein